MTKTVSERLRDYAACKTNTCIGFRKIVTGVAGCTGIDCVTCRGQIANVLADMIEAGQAVNPSKSTGLPEGIEWPRFEDGELVKFGDEVFIPEAGNKTIKVDEIRLYSKRLYINGTTCDGAWLFTPILSFGTPVKRPELLDADGVPIKVGDTVYNGHHVPLEVTKVCADGIWLNIINGKAEVRANPRTLTHRKPDTHGDIEDDATLPPKEYCNRHQLLGADSAYFDDAEVIEAMCKHLIERTRKVCERQRKVLGGE